MKPARMSRCAVSSEAAAKRRRSCSSRESAFTTRMPVMFSRMTRTTSSMPRCTRSYRGMPLRETQTTSAIMTGAMMQRIDARRGSITSVMPIPPRSMIGARMPIVCEDWMKDCTL